ncbi:hypothetical protein BDZ89DRAFT_1167993 [Hymenopellis radicata]|nr:hypothetical protein BDZ89DRAFT_1167993 [Hymenopellis radicata]
MSTIAEQLGLSQETVQRLIGDYLNAHILAVFAYALYIMIFGATMRLMVQRGQWSPRRITLTVILCLIWAFATVSLGVAWNAMYATYVTHGQTQDAIFGYMLGIGSGNFTSQRLSLNLALAVTTALNAILAELINIWRCWELYHRNWLVPVVPFLGVICGLLSQVFALVTLYPSSGPKYASSLALINWTVVYYAVTASVNILTTTLIITRILLVSGLKRARTYRGLIAILIESAFLYSATYIVYLALYVRDAPSADRDAFVYVQGLLSAVTATAPTLIIGRVVTGEAHPDDSWTRTCLPHMSTTVRRTAESIRFASFRPARTQDTNAVELPNASSEFDSSEQQSKARGDRDVA